MRVLHLYAGNLYGGIERVLATLARERRLVSDMNPAFGLCFRGRLSDELLAAGVPVFDLGSVRFSRPWTVWRARWRLARLLRRERFDVVMTHAAWPHAVFARTVRAARVPLAHWVHDPMTGTGNRFEVRAARTPPDLAIVNSRFTAATVANVFPSVRTEVVYLPVAHTSLADEPTLRVAARAEFATPLDHVVILQACRLERWKGHAVLVEALGQLRDLPGWTAWVAGGPQKDGEVEYLNELKAIAVGGQIADRVCFVGQRADVPQLLVAADVLCQPNTGPEPFGIAFVEALYAGRAVVASNAGGATEVIDASCGVLVPAGDVATVASVLRDLILDPIRRRALGAAGPARAQALCDPTRQIGRVAELLRGLAV